MNNKYVKDVEFIKIDNNIILDMNSIKWVKKIEECMEICTKGNGCYVGDTLKLCKINNPASFDRLNKHFE